jgi:hypothetical protein
MFAASTTVRNLGVCSFALVRAVDIVASGVRSGLSPLKGQGQTRADY